MVSDKREGTAIKGLKAHLTRLAASVGRPLRRLLGPEAIPIAPQDAAELLKQGHRLVFLDARNSAAWSEAQMKLPGARRIELDDIDTVSNELPQDALIVTYCTWLAEGSSARAAFMLVQRGFPDVRYLRGGFDAWRQQGYPLEAK